MTYRAPNTSDVVCSACGAATAREDSVFDASGALLCRSCHAVAESHVQVERARVSQREDVNRLAAHGGILGLAIGAAVKDGVDNAARGEHADIARHARSRPGPSAIRCPTCGAFMDGGGGSCAACAQGNAAPDELTEYLRRRQRNQRLVIAGLLATMILAPAIAYLLGARDVLHGILLLELFLGAGLVRAIVIRVRDRVL